MKRSVSAMTLRRNLGQIMNEVALRGDTVIVERDGKPLVALVSVRDLETVEKARQAAWEQVFATIETIHERNRDVDPAVLQAEIEEATRAVRATEPSETAHVARGI